MEASDLPDVPTQLVVFAREMAELYPFERSRNAELDDRTAALYDRIAELKSAILRHLAADHKDGSASELRDALQGTADD